MTNNPEKNFTQIASSSRFVGDLTERPEVGGGTGGKNAIAEDGAGALGGLYLPRPKAVSKPKVPSMHDTWSDELRKEANASMRGTDAYSRHKKYINDYIIAMGRWDEYVKEKKSKIRHRTDWDVYQEGFQFIRSDDEKPLTWEEELCQKYYSRLFKEYCLTDLSQYKKGRVGLRWRVHEEVVSGKGQFMCGNIHCDSNIGLQSIETLFSYVEQGEQKSALVKCRLCKECAPKLGYKKNKEKKKRERKEEKKDKKQRKKMKKEEKEEKTVESTDLKESDREDNVWKTPLTKGPSRVEQFDDYFEGLFP